MEAPQTDEQITPITTIKRHRTAAGRVRHRPRSLDDSGGRSPLITWDLDLYPQPPTNNRSPTLNSEGRLNHRIRAGTPAQGASITSTTTRPWPCAIQPTPRAASKAITGLYVEHQSL